MEADRSQAPGTKNGTNHILELHLNSVKRVGMEMESHGIAFGQLWRSTMERTVRVFFGAMMTFIWRDFKGLRSVRRRNEAHANLLQGVGVREETGIIGISELNNLTLALTHD